MIAVRETIESIVIAFVLAFLFRTFEAEAFVIPTGSMSPSLQGQHKDVHCHECGYRFRTTASSEGEDRMALISRLQSGQVPLHERDQIQRNIRGLEVVAGMCPMCRHTMLYREDGLPGNLPGHINPSEVSSEDTSYPGDRILVNKYSYAYKDPSRWDVIVFKFPGNGEMNYIKRLVGLPNETLRVYQGDVFIKPNEPDADFHIERKPPDKVLAMLQPVHDTNYDPSILYRAGWPLRWSDAGTNGWEIETNADENVVRQTYRFVANDQPTEEMPLAWLRYRHLIPSEGDWMIARDFAQTAGYPRTGRDEWLDSARPELISDYNPYNARILRSQLQRGAPFQVEPYQLGMQWVSDLAVRCEVLVQRPQGELVLDLVRAGKHFSCHLNLQTGEATLQIDGMEDFQPRASTPVSKAGKFRLLFANVDDQLLLWVNDSLVCFDSDNCAAIYDADEVFGGRENAIPQTAEDDEGDLSPVGIGARGAVLEITRLEVLRDIYYVSADDEDLGIPARWSQHHYYTDYQNPNEAVQLPDGTRLPPLSGEREIFRDPETWPRFLTRRHRDFPIEQAQYFVLGDNSPESLDCRLWERSAGSKGSPGGSYLDAQLMTGEAICVFWPHSWGSIPGLDRMPGFPNFKDMRLVR